MTRFNRAFIPFIAGLVLTAGLMLVFTIAALAVTCPTCGSSNVNEVSRTDPYYDTDTGTITYWCNDCMSTGTITEWTVTIPAQGHDYSVVIDSTPATCTASGSQTLQCSHWNCGVPNGDITTRTIPALGHNYVETIDKPNTCTEDGHASYRCSRCGDSYEKTLPATGHAYGEPILVEPTCTADGSDTIVCGNCGDRVVTVLPALGHDHPDEWTVVDEPTQDKAGLRKNVCTRCGETLWEQIPALGGGGVTPDPDTDVTPGPVPAKKPSKGMLAGGAAALLALLGLGYVVVIRPRRLAAAAVAAAAAGAAGWPVLEPLEDKIVLSCLSAGEYNDSLRALFRAKTYLKLADKPFDERGKLPELADEIEPDLVVLSVDGDADLEAFQALKERMDDQDFALVLGGEYATGHDAQFKQLKADGAIVGYATPANSANTALVRMILPLYRLGGDSTVEYIGAVAELLGIGPVGALARLFVNGRELKDSVARGELGVDDEAEVAGNIAAVLGFDFVESIMEFISDICEARDSAQMKDGVTGTKHVGSAAKGLADIVGDILG